MPKKFKDLSFLKVLTVAVSAIAVVYVSGVLYRLFLVFFDVFLILLLAWLISFIFDPLVELMQNWRIPRLFSALIVYTIFSLLSIWLFVRAIPVLIVQINSLLGILPPYLDQVPGWTNRLVDFSLSALTSSLAFVQKLASVIFYFVFILVLSFYLVVDKQKIWRVIIDLIPKQYHDDILFLQNTIDNSFAGFLRAQIIVGLMFGIITLVFLLFVSPDFALLAGFLAGLLNILPLIGPFLALIPPFIVLLPLGLSQALWLTAVLLIVQQVEFNVLAPKIFGRTMKLHPIWVLVSFLLGFKIAGIWGSIFAVPAASIINVFFTSLLGRFLRRIG